jgi:hypothetical protein
LVCRLGAEHVHTLHTLCRLSADFFRKSVRLAHYAHLTRESAKSVIIWLAHFAHFCSGVQTSADRGVLRMEFLSNLRQFLLSVLRKSIVYLELLRKKIRLLRTT